MTLFYVISLDAKDRIIRRVRLERDEETKRGNKFRRQVKALEADCRELNDNLQELSSLTCITQNRNTRLQEELDFAEELKDEEEIQEEEEDDVGTVVSAKELDDAYFRFNTIKRNPIQRRLNPKYYEINPKPVNDLNKYDVKIAIHELEKGDK